MVIRTNNKTKIAKAVKITKDKSRAYHGRLEIVIRGGQIGGGALYRHRRNRFFPIPFFFSLFILINSSFFF